VGEYSTKKNDNFPLKKFVSRRFDKTKKFLASTSFNKRKFSKVKLIAVLSKMNPGSKNDTVSKCTYIFN